MSSTCVFVFCVQCVKCVFDLSCNRNEVCFRPECDSHVLCTHCWTPAAVFILLVNTAAVSVYMCAFCVSLPQLCFFSLHPFPSSLLYRLFLVPLPVSVLTCPADVLCVLYVHLLTNVKQPPASSSCSTSQTAWCIQSCVLAVILFVTTIYSVYFAKK